MKVAYSKRYDKLVSKVKYLKPRRRSRLISQLAPILFQVIGLFTDAASKTPDCYEDIIHTTLHIGNL